MRHAAAGDLLHAIAAFRRLVQYDLCCRALMEELGVEPDEDTRALHASILQPAAPTVQRTLHTVHQPHHQPHPPLSPAPPLSAATVDFPLVGRKAEFQSLLTTWTKSVQSGTRMVFIAGEAGIGKTRLAEELLLHVQRQGHIAVRARAYALEGRLAYAPMADWLRSTPLQASLARLDRVWLRELSHLLPELLILYPDLPPPEPLAERWQQKRLFEALRHAFTVDSRPLLLLLDDLQWCDAETLAWLQYLVETAPQAALLIVGTIRVNEIDDEHPLHQLRRALLREGRLSTIDLVPLSAEDTAALGAEVREYALDGVAAASLYQATAGNPLYVIETIRAGAKFLAQGRHYSQHTAPPSTRESNAGLPPKVFAAIFYSFLRDKPAVQGPGEGLTTVSIQVDFPLFVTTGQMLRGWALAQQGDVESGLPLVQLGIEGERSRGIRMFEPHSRSLLAETLALAGQWEEALDEVTEALAYAEECGNAFWNAHLLKLQGDYMQALSLSIDEAETCYQRAIATAQQQSAKSLELRATTSLCRLWQAQGKSAEAYSLLSAIYSWFTEGFDTADLREAMALLDTLKK